MAKVTNTAAPAPVAAATVRNANHVLQVVIPPTFKAPKGNTARAAWLAALQAHNGKTVAQFTAAVTAKHPSTPTKGKLAGQLEPVPGWLNHFSSAKGGNVLTLVPPKG